MPSPKLTVDTNIVRDALDSGRDGYQDARKLRDLHQAGRCEIAITARIDVDVPRDPLRNAIKALPFVRKRVGTLFRVGYTGIGSGYDRERRTEARST